MELEQTLIDAKNACSEFWLTLRQDSSLAEGALRWAAVNWVGVGLDVKGDALALTLSFSQPPPFPEALLRTTLRLAIPALPREIDFDIKVIPPYRPLGAGPEVARPGIPALSIGVSAVGFQAGTLGAIVRRAASPDQWLILSNNHILYNNVAVLGLLPVPVSSPAPALSMNPRVIGTVREVPQECILRGRARNDGDYAIADIDDKTRVSTAPQPGMPPLSGRMPIDPKSATDKPVKKAGARTGVTSGKVMGIMHDFPMTFDSMGGATFLFQDQVRISDAGQPFSAGGDSGSLVVTLEGEPVGVLFASNGSDTMASPLVKLFCALGLSFV
jgi:hypothetical protein